MAVADLGDAEGHQQRSAPIPRFLSDELALPVAGKSQEDLLFTTRRGDGGEEPELPARRVRSGCPNHRLGRVDAAWP
jgi:hypothetical protein